MVRSERAEGTRIRVLLVGGCQDLTDVRQVLATVPDIVAVRVQGFDLALAEAERLRPDVVLVSRRLEPPFDGLQLARALRWNDPGVAVVVVSDRPDTFLAEQALLQGAAGVISPSLDAAGLSARLSEAARGHLALDDELRDALTFEVYGAPSAEDERLLHLIGSGQRTVDDIAETLGCTWREVEDALGEMERRLGLVGRASLLLYADAFHRAA